MYISEINFQLSCCFLNIYIVLMCFSPLTWDIFGDFFWCAAQRTSCFERLMFAVKAEWNYCLHLLSDRLLHCSCSEHIFTCCSQLLYHHQSVIFQVPLLFRRSLQNLNTEWRRFIKYKTFSVQHTCRQAFSVLCSELSPLWTHLHMYIRMYIYTSLFI